jgi:hypothetical protein
VNFFIPIFRIGRDDRLGQHDNRDAAHRSGNSTYVLLAAPALADD